MTIKVENIRKNFGDFVALNNVSLEIRPGELVALLGPSGSGKTTLLRIIAGLENAEHGKVIIDGKVTSKKSKVKDRNVSFVFQHYALFKHMTVFENIAFGLRVRPKKSRLSNDEINKKVMNLLRLVHLDGMHNRFPSQLSGGQRQRVALARALAVEPRVLLLDEPFGALDAKVRKELRRWIRRLHDEIHITSVFVTHDQEEAMEVADRVVVMSNGRIEQVGTPNEVWQKPANSFVYDFLGNYNEFEGWKDDRGKVHLTEYDFSEDGKSIEEKPASWWDNHPEIARMLGISKTEKKQRRKQEKLEKLHGKKVKLFARPHEMEVTKKPGKYEYITAKVIHINPAGSLVKLELERKNGSVLQAEISNDLIHELKIKKNDEVFVRPREVKVFD